MSQWPEEERICQLREEEQETRERLWKIKLKNAMLNETLNHFPEGWAFLRELDQENRGPQ